MSIGNEEQERRSKLLADMMHDDAKDGLYEEQPKREPLLSDADIDEMDGLHHCDYKAGEPPSFGQEAKEARDFYESKTASGELIINPDFKP